MECLECCGNQTMQQDMEYLAKRQDFSFLKNQTVLVTGATGLIGSQMVYLLSCLNRMAEMQIHVIAMARSREKAQKLFGHLAERGDVTFLIGDVNDAILSDDAVDYIIHGASATSSKYFVEHPAETIGTAINGTRNILEFAKNKGAKGMVYLSSLEVYGVPQNPDGMTTEDDYGYINPLSVRSSYSEGKRMAECLCVSYAKEYGVPVKIARLSQTFGPGVEYNDGRVFAEFARCALEQRNIVLHTQGKTVRSYCYTRDALAALLLILQRGTVGEAYNVTNMDTAVSILEMAELAAATIGKGQIQVAVEIPEDVASFGYNPEMVIRLDSTKLNSLGWKATVGLEEMFERLAAGMKR